MVLNTERLKLRNFELTDLNDIFEYSSDPDVGTAAGWPPHKTLDDSKFALNEIFLPNKTCLAIVLPDNGSGKEKVIGSVGFLKNPTRKNPKSLMAGYALGKLYWGKGYMTECMKEVLRWGFEDLSLDIVSISHYTDNKRSERVIQKLGFYKEGCLRQAELLFNGEVKDEIVYSLTKEEWKATLLS